MFIPKPKFNIGDLIMRDPGYWPYYRIGVIIDVFLYVGADEDEFEYKIKWINVEEVPFSCERERNLALVSKVKY